jgi:NAD(P)-dependent dehydrogenase (short-subunit alcohol dehydrogenase family)
MVATNMFDLEGRIVLLTGAAGYLGKAMSTAILEAGADLIMSGRRVEALEAYRYQLVPALKPHCHIVASDITKKAGVALLIQIIQARFPCIHGLVNNAYAGRSGTIDVIGPEDFITACQYNLIAPFALIKGLQPLLEIGFRKTGITSSVINIASMYGSVSSDPSVYGDSGKNNPVHYGATKGGLIQMTRYLACHLGVAGIRVNSIAPGPFPNTAIDSGIPTFFDKLADKVPLKRLGKPHEVAGPVVFLLSNAASYVNGINLAVDGGWTAW